MLIFAAQKHGQCGAIRPKIIDIVKGYQFGQPITIGQVNEPALIPDIKNSSRNLLNLDCKLNCKPVSYRPS